jgi:hypothetical protein
MEEMIAQRLFDNASLIDRLLSSGPVDQKTLAEIAPPLPLACGMMERPGSLEPAPGAAAGVAHRAQL